VEGYKAARKRLTAVLIRELFRGANLREHRAVAIRKLMGNGNEKATTECFHAKQRIDSP
jgi:hypothetical protein